MKSTTRLLPAFLVLLAPIAAAQTPTALLVGRVMSGRTPLPGVTVTVSSRSSVVTRSTITGGTGKYAIDALPPGRYNVTFTREGYQTVSRPAELHLGLTGRADANLKATDVVESISLTAATPSILEAAQIATTLAPSLVDELPIRRGLPSRALLAPAVLLTPEGALTVNGEVATGTLYLIDGVPSRSADGRPKLVIEEALDETTVMTGAIPAEYGSFSGGVIAASTRSGSNELTGSLRIDVLQHADDLLQATVGGRVIDDRLWFFGAGAAGDEGTASQRRAQAKFTGAITESQFGVASYTHGFDGDSDAGSALSLHYNAEVGGDTVVEALYGRSPADRPSWIVKGSHIFSASWTGIHSFSAGVEQLAFGERRAIFVDDRWSTRKRWTIAAGLRYDDRLQPRLAAIYDLHGDGLRRVSAGWARYNQGDRSVDEVTADYGVQISNNGFVRLSAIRRTSDGERTWRAAELQWNYSLLGIVDFGGYYTLTDGPDSATGWIIVQPPTGFGRVSFAILEPYRDGNEETDLSGTFAFPVSNATAFVKADLVNAFGGHGVAGVQSATTIDATTVVQPHGMVGQPRTWRLAVGVRF